MTLKEFCNTLPKDKQIQLALILTKRTVPVWDEYADDHSLSYRDTVVGMTHTVPKQLLMDTISQVEKYISRLKLLRSFNDKDKLLKLYSYFSDPIVALQDTDWELPGQVQKTFYSVYNLIGSIVDPGKGFDESRLYVSINQAIDVITTGGLLSENQIKDILAQTKNGK